MAKYIVRLDDIHDRMDKEKFHEVMAILFAHGCVPLLGVIPNNQDPSLNRGEPIDGLDQLLGKWSSQGLVDIAMHGYQHQYVTKHCGLMSGLGLKPQSEFAGVSLEEQASKISNGKKIMEKRGLATDIFMAPGHTFDDNTIHALKENGFTYITDGVGVYPIVRNGITLIPQQIAKPRVILLPGVFTLCIHADTINECYLNQLVEFSKRCSKNFLRIREVCLDETMGKRIVNKSFEKIYRMIAHIKRR